MAAVVIACPECKKKFKGREEFQGKKIKCPACSHPFIVKSVAVDKPASDEDALKPLAEGPPGAEGRLETHKAAGTTWDEELDGGESNPYDVTTLDIAPRCPLCANLMASEEAIICLYCGYNTLTRERGATKKVIQHTGSEQLIWLLPGILCVLGMLLIVNGDIFFCLVVPDMVRQSWLEFTDHESVRLWTVLPSLSIIWGLGYFAYKRLVLEPLPPEKKKE